MLSLINSSGIKRTYYREKLRLQLGQDIKKNHSFFYIFFCLFCLFSDSFEGSADTEWRVCAVEGLAWSWSSGWCGMSWVWRWERGGGGRQAEGAGGELQQEAERVRGAVQGEVSSLAVAGVEWSGSHSVSFSSSSSVRSSTRGEYSEKYLIIIIHKIVDCSCSDYWSSWFLFSLLTVVADSKFARVPLILHTNRQQSFHNKLQHCSVLLALPGVDWWKPSITSCWSVRKSCRIRVKKRRMEVWLGLISVFKLASIRAERVSCQRYHEHCLNVCLFVLIQCLKQIK